MIDFIIDPLSAISRFLFFILFYNLFFNIEFELSADKLKRSLIVLKMMQNTTFDSYIYIIKYMGPFAIL